MKPSLSVLKMCILVVASLMVLPGCRTRPVHHSDAPHWSYSGTTGPAHWGDLSPEFVVATTGRQQSPVDIAGAEVAAGSLAFDYSPSTLHLVNNGHTIQQNWDAGSSLRVGDRRFELKQLHFHSPSEHTIAGKRYDMEVHLVHVSQSGEIAVVGILLQTGAENAFLQQFWDRLPTRSGQEERLTSLRIDAAAALPDDSSCYAYHGSLTTPPCTEGVQWYVMSQAQTLSADQLRVFRQVYNGNYRPVQPLNERSILHLK